MIKIQIIGMRCRWSCHYKNGEIAKSKIAKSKIIINNPESIAQCLMPDFDND
jgi:hypothetical protein